MADRARSSSTTPTADPIPLTRDPHKSTNKRKNTSATGSPANKRPYIDSPSNSDDIEDTATSKAIDEEVGVEDIEVLQGLLDYHSRKGVLPFENSTAMHNFCRPWLILGFGNEKGWTTKIEQVKMKFKNRTAPIEPGEREEFELWMKIWGKEGGGGDDQSGGS